MTTKNVVNLYHGGDLGDTVYAVPALRRLANPVHLTLYPNHGATRVLMDRANADQVIPLLNAQPGVSADWQPGFEADGLRLDFGVRRFYKNGYNLADIHSNWVGHDHWHPEHPWLTVDEPLVNSPYRIVVARSARYRNDGFPWKHLYDQFAGRAVFVGVPWEHEDFEARYGKIDYVRTPSLLDAARLMANADVFIGNQSCPRAVAEGLKIPVVVEAGDPNNTHFGREFAWYPTLGDSIPQNLKPETLEQIWCGAAAKRALDFSDHQRGLLEELARLARRVRDLPGVALEIGVGRGGSAATIAWALQRTIHLCDNFADGDVRESVKHIDAFLRVYNHHLHVGDFPATVPPDARFSFVHVDTDVAKDLETVQEWVLPRMLAGGIIVLNGFSAREIDRHSPKLGMPTPIDRPTNYPGLYAFQIRG